MVDKTDVDCVAMCVREFARKNGGDIPDEFTLEINDEPVEIVDAWEENDIWYCPVKGRDFRLIVARRKFSFLRDENTGDIDAFDCECDHSDEFEPLE